MRSRIHDSIYENDRKVGYGIDAGILVVPFEWLSFGSYMRDIIKTEDISEKKIESSWDKELSAGFSFFPERMPILINLDMLYDFGTENFKTAFGLEYQFRDIVSYRIGALNDQTFSGFGLKVMDFSLNYTFSFSGNNPSHYITFVHSFGTKMRDYKEAQKLFRLAQESMDIGDTFAALSLFESSFELDSLNEEIYLNYKRFEKISTFENQLPQNLTDDDIKRVSEISARYKAVNLGALVNSISAEGLPALTADGKTMFYTSTRTGGYLDTDNTPTEDFWYSQQVDGMWQSPRNVGNVINSGLNEGACSISSSSQTIYFSSIDPLKGSGLDIYMSKLEGTNWTEPVNLGENVNSKTWDSHPSISGDHRSLYFSSRRNGGRGGYDIWVSNYINSEWTVAVNLGPTVNSTMNERFPYIFYDNKTLYFASDRPGGFGGIDVYMTKMGNKGNWSKPINIGPEFNSSKDENSFIIEPSGRWAFFSSDRDGGYGRFDIYKIRVPEMMRPDTVITVKGIVNDTEDKPIKVIIVVNDLENGIELFRAENNSETGEYILNLPVGKVYSLLIMSDDGFISREEKLDLTEVQFYQEVQKNYALYSSDNKVYISGQISDFYTNEPIGAKIRVEVLETGEEIANFFSDYKNGQYKVEVPVDRNYNIAVNAESYFFESEIVVIEEEIVKDETIIKDFKLKLVRVGEKVKINNILFDFDKASLRPETYIELNRAIEMLKKYLDIGIEIGGHTDNVGSEEYNLRLSQSRCDSIKSYLIKKGIEESRLITIGCGENQPVADNDTETGRQLNRRTEFTVIEVKKTKNNIIK